MKKLFSLLAMCLVSLGMMAQAQLVVTVTHGETTTAYYGIDAFQTAVNAAQNGDLLTFSPGIFHGANINNKGITLRGNGCEGENATIIDTDISIEKPAADGTPTLNIQGFDFKKSIKFSGSVTNEDILISKCNMNSLWTLETSRREGVVKKLNVIQCKIKEFTTFLQDSEANFINSVVAKLQYGYYNQHNFSFTNCVLYMPIDQKVTFFARNSVIVTNSGAVNGSFIVPPTLENCIVAGTLEEMSNIIPEHTATASQYMPLTSVFKTATNNVYADDTFELTESAAAILGTDGTQLGIHGGSLPYDPTTSYPRFITFDVAEKTVDGKLAVSVSTTE